MKDSSIISSEEVERIVYDYQPKKFVLEPAEVAQEYVSEHDKGESDFQLSDISAKQAGISKLNRQKQDRIVDELVLEKLKEVQEVAYQEAYDLGVAEGAERAFVEMQGEFVDRLNDIDQVLKTIDDVKKRIFDHNEAHFVRLLYLIARKISLIEIEQDSEYVTKLIKVILEEVRGEENVVLKLCPEDLFFLEGLRDRNLKELEVLKTVKLDVDDSVKAGGCLLETNYGVIDATLDKRVDKVWDLLQARLPRMEESERTLPLNNTDEASEEESKKDSSDPESDDG